jgi:hypothetical protein
MEKETKNRYLKIVETLVYCMYGLIAFALYRVLFKIQSFTCLEVKDKLYLSLMVIFMLLYILINYINLYLRNNKYS